MHTSQWDRQRFKDVLEEIQRRTNLSQTELAKLAGRNRTQINRWVRAENQPAYTALQQLATATAARYPDVADLARELMAAAGYPETGSHAHAALNAAAEMTAAEVVPAPPKPPTIAEMRAEIARLMAQMTPQERAGLERTIAAEEEELEALRVKRRLRWLRLMRGERIDPEADL